VDTLAAPPVSTPSARPVHWGYEGGDGPAAWASLSPVYDLCGSGKGQSPIALTSSSKGGDAKWTFNYGSTLFRMAHHEHVDALVDNGHTIQVSVEEGSTLALNGRVYTLKQFHFHTPSEHTLDGKNLPMEMHLVHQDSAGGFAVVSILFEEGKANPNIAKLVANLPAAKGDPFSDPGTLAQYAVIIFSNTSGNAILDEGQRANFEQWVANGGRVLGIHAASDTYRHSTANGNNTGTWDFFPELIGASVQENPNHVDGTPTYILQRVGAHPATYNVPDQWVKAEEYYYWENGYFAELNTPMLVVEETVGPNGEVNSYDAPRPMSWYRTPGSSRVVYTALGHAAGNYTSDVIFRAHMRDAWGWLLQGATSVQEQGGQGPALFPNPTEATLTIRTAPEAMNRLLTLSDLAGRTIRQERVTQIPVMVDVSALPAGVYTLAIAGLDPQLFVVDR